MFCCDANKNQGKMPHQIFELKEYKETDHELYARNYLVFNQQGLYTTKKGCKQCTIERTNINTN